MPYTPLGFVGSYVPDITIEFFYSIDLTQSASRAIGISDYEFTCFIDNATPVTKSCVGDASGTEPYTYDDGPQEANALLGLVNSIYISRSICNDGGSGFTIEDKNCKLYKNSVLLAEYSNSSSETPPSCPSTSTYQFTQFSSLEFTVYHGDNIRVEWYDTN